MMVLDGVLSASCKELFAGLYSAVSLELIIRP